MRGGKRNKWGSSNLEIKEMRLELEVLNISNICHNIEQEIY